MNDPNDIVFRYRKYLQQYIKRNSVYFETQVRVEEKHGQFNIDTANVSGRRKYTAQCDVKQIPIHRAVLEQFVPVIQIFW